MSTNADKASNNLNVSGIPWVNRLDPRVRIVWVVLYAFAIISTDCLWILLSCCVLGLSLLFHTRQLNGATLKKVVTMDGFIIFLLCLLPFTTPGEVLFTVWGYNASVEGSLKALDIILTANAVVLAMLALISTIDAVMLGHALHHLKVPNALVHLLLFSVRYIDVLKQEYHRLRIAMRARCFKAGNNMHTYQSIGYLLGMMLIRSLERSERILEAMKCRGFNGNFYLLDEFIITKRDYIFSGCSLFFILIILFAG